MITQLQTLDNGKPALDFDTDYLHWVFNVNVEHCNASANVNGFRGWALGKIEETMSAAYAFMGDIKPWEGWENWKDWAHPGDLDRTAGRYESFEAKAGRRKPTGRPLRGTNELVHPSVRIRVSCGGKGADDQGSYSPRGLKGLKLTGPPGADPRDPMAEGFRWEGKHDGRDVVLEEDTISGLEIELLVASAKAVAARQQELGRI
jgi:hypothetical protein